MFNIQIWFLETDHGNQGKGRNVFHSKLLVLCCCTYIVFRILVLDIKKNVRQETKVLPEQ